MISRSFGMVLLVVCTLASAGGAQTWPNAQGWSSLDHMILSTLTNSGSAESAFWLPDEADPAQAARGLGVAYEHIPGAAGNVGIALGYFVRSDTGWQLVGPVDGVFGHSPRDPVYGDGTMELTTTTLGPNDPRCCPSLPVRWRIDLDTLSVQRLD